MGVFHMRCWFVADHILGISKIERKILTKTERNISSVKIEEDILLSTSKDPKRFSQHHFWTLPARNMFFLNR